ncbi:MAG TPA: HAMP domain-containing sensor histidine kinase [Kofleriaceae bacterium]|nr:HAMP domain-containing sensor histidine kinase [Kofleriaceae bacterium]
MRRAMRFEMKARIGYATLLVLLAAGMAWSIRRLADLSNEQVATLRAEEHELTLVEQLRWSGEQIVSNGKGYLLAADPQQLERIRAAAARFDARLAELHAKTLDAPGRAMVDDVEVAGASFRDVQEQLLAARRVAAEPGPLVARFEAELLPLRAELDRALDLLVDYKEIALPALYEQARLRRERVVTQLYALVGLLVAIGLLVTLYFSRLLSRAYRLEREANETAQRAAAARDELMGVVAHDLRNPLGAIMMKAELLEHGSDVERVRRQAASIASVAKRMEHLIKSMLDVTTLEAGRFTVSPEPCAVTGLVRDATDIFAAQAASRGVTLEPVVPDAALQVRADRERVLQVLSNLVGNALKFTPADGRVTLAVQREDGFARFTVTDTGPGIPDEDRARIFDRYWKRETGGTKGTGLGLFIAKGIVDAHDGRIWVESAPGRGSAFHFTLPSISGA